MEEINICPIHKKSEKQIIKNYRPVSLLPICGKIFERLIFNSLCEYLEKYKLLINLVLKPTILGKISCFLSSLTFIQPLIHPAYESHGVLLDMSRAFSKVFDTVWHEGLIF